MCGVEALTVMVPACIRWMALLLEADAPDNAVLTYLIAADAGVHPEGGAV
jgi:hypothetical protein